MSPRLREARNRYEGSYFTNSCGETCRVVVYENAKEVYITFDGSVYPKPFRIGNLVRGEFTNSYRPAVRGVGYLGIGEYSAKNKMEYLTWTNMLKRAYDDKTKDVQPSYKSSKVCDEWLNFQNFAKWCNSQEFFNAKDAKGRSYQLDKDLIVLGSKTYSPESCCFIPQSLNLAVSKRISNRKHPTGVRFDDKVGKFSASLTKFSSRVSLGYFDNKQEAFLAFKFAKEKYIKDLAGIYKGSICNRAYKALLSYQVSEETSLLC